MTKTATVSETVSFSLKIGTTEAEFLTVFEPTQKFVEAREGYVRRTLSGQNGKYVDCVEWTDLALAQAAAEALMQTPEVGPFMSMIDEASIVMRHEPILRQFG